MSASGTLIRISFIRLISNLQISCIIITIMLDSKLMPCTVAFNFQVASKLFCLSINKSPCGLHRCYGPANQIIMSSDGDPGVVNLPDFPMSISCIFFKFNSTCCFFPYIIIILSNHHYSIHHTY